MADPEQATEDKVFLAEAEVMDLAPIKEKMFAVAVGTGDPESVKFLCKTVHGPYSFVEMVQEVGEMWVQHQHHAKAVVLEKDPKARVVVLNANTIDYIEAHYNDIIMEEMLKGTFDPNKEFTCVAGTVEDKEET
jgi:hypothetical protein